MNVSLVQCPREMNMNPTFRERGAEHALDGMLSRIKRDKNLIAIHLRQSLGQMVR